MRVRIPPGVPIHLKSENTTISYKKKYNKSIGIELQTFNPITKNQEKAFKQYGDKNLVLYGTAGTGKSFISMYLALSDVLNNKNNNFNRLVIFRSVVPSRDMGFLPGDADEKSSVYEVPYRGITAELCKRGDAYEVLKAKGIIDFSTTSFNRGITINNSIVIVDEIQNMNFVELHTIITRVGENTKILFCGDYHQCDLVGKSGILDFIKILKNMPSFSLIEFGIDDIVRSNLVREYIITKENIGL